MISLGAGLAEIVTNWDLKSAGLDIDIRHDLAIGPKYGAAVRMQSRGYPN